MITPEQANKIRSLFNEVVSNVMKTRDCQPLELGNCLQRASDSRQNLEMFLSSLTDYQQTDVKIAVAMGLDRYNEAFLTISKTESGKND